MVAPIAIPWLWPEADERLMQCVRLTLTAGHVEKLRGLPDRLVPRVQAMLAKAVPRKAVRAEQVSERRRRQPQENLATVCDLLFERERRNSGAHPIEGQRGRDSHHTSVAK